VTSRPWQISIRARLALIYAAILGASLLVYGTGVYLVLRDQLEHAFDAQLLANVEHAAGAFAQDIDAAGRLVPSARLVTQFASTGGRVVVLDRDAIVVADSSPGEPALEVAPSDLPHANDGAHIVGIRSGAQGTRTAIHPVLGPDGGLAGSVVWADSIRQTEELLAAVTTAMLSGGLVIVIVAAVVGLALARRALTPIAEVTETARAITLSGDLGERVEVGQARDEVADLEIAFNEMLTALQQSHETLRQFLADVSHQLRTPLTTIRANVELAQREGISADERAELLSDAREESERMARLVRDLLSLARAEAGASLELEPVELDALLVDTVRIQRQAATHVHLSVATVEPALVEGDPDRLRELFGILLDNAARYTPEGGSVTAALRVERHEAIVTVADTGIGIDEEDRDRLFERLHRGAVARRLRPSGTGLGLAIAKWIVESHGGRIGLSARADGGAIAEVRLPIH
jgi:signal transduction histidine kinase